MRNKDLGKDLNRMFTRFRLQRGTAYGVIIITALLAFEAFNYSTTEFALADFLGDLSFMSIRWATILAIAFCCMDFAGIARLFTPEEGGNEPSEVWYLFGAWLLAATMNAMLTWWGVSIAIINHETLGSAVVSRATLLRVVPIFMAVLVWLIRVLVIGTFSVAGERMFSQVGKESRSQLTMSRGAKSGNHSSGPGYQQPEPTYAPVSMSSRPDSSDAQSRVNESVASTVLAPTPPGRYSGLRGPFRLLEDAFRWARSGFPLEQ